MTEKDKADLINIELCRVTELLKKLGSNAYYEAIYKKELNFLANYKFALKTYPKESDVEFILKLLDINSEYMDKIELVYSQKKPLPKNNKADECETYSELAEMLNFTRVAANLRDIAIKTRHGKHAALLYEDKDMLDEFVSFLEKKKENNTCVNFNENNLKRLKFICASYFLLPNKYKTPLLKDINYKYTGVLAYINGLEQHVDCKKENCYLKNTCKNFNSMQDIYDFLNNNFGISQIEKDVVGIMGIISDVFKDKGLHTKHSYNSVINRIRKKHVLLKSEGEKYFNTEVDVLELGCDPVIQKVKKYRAKEKYKKGAIVLLTKTFGYNGVDEYLDMISKPIYGIIIDEITVDFGCENYRKMMANTNPRPSHAQRFIGCNVLINNIVYFMPIKYIEKRVS